MNLVYRDFEKDLDMGIVAENKLLSKFQRVFVPLVQQIIYEPTNAESVKLQKSGVDVIISTKEVRFDVKCRRFDVYKWNDILLETVSVVETETPGWLYKSDVVVYVWENISRTSFIDGYILYLDKIRPWFVEHESKFKQKTAFSERNGNKWSTLNRAVPIKQFPIGSIQKIPTHIFKHCKQSVLEF